MAKTAANPENKLTVAVRTETGKGASRQARRDGSVPVVLYGHGTEPQHLQLNAHDFAAVLRHGILRERLADILTDTFRALALQAMGYRTQVVEFVSADATPKNLLLRAEKVREPGDADALREYAELKQFWGVEPAIGGLLRERFGQIG